MKMRLLERKMFTRLFCTAAMAGMIFLPVRQSNAAALPEISVSGNMLVADGQEIVLRGVNALDPLALNRYIGHWENDYFARISSWGAKVVRLPIHPGEWKNRFYNGSGSCTFPLSYQECRDRMTVIEQAVSWAADNGMYSIIDWHVIGSLVTRYFQDRSYVTTQAETEDFWRQIATRFKDDSRVAAYELLNEPVTDKNGWQVSESQWIAQRDWYEALVDVIRAIDPDKPIICNGLDWGYNLSFAGDFPVSRSSIIYGAHPYPVKSLPWDNYFGYLKATYPVLATEFGFQNDGSAVYDEIDYYGGGSYRVDLDTYLESKGIGWMVWNYGPEWAPLLILDWNYTPSEQGAFYRDQMLTADGNPPPDGGVMHVFDIVMSFIKTKNNYKAAATVTVADDNNQPVEGATVYGIFSGATNDIVNGRTAADGWVTLTSSGKKNGGTWTFRVNSVTKSGWTYDPNLNIKTSDNISAP
jgi:endoglucanase